MADRPLTTGLFPDRDSAEQGYNALTERGYVIAGALAAAIAGAGAGAATGGLVGALVGWNMHEERVKRHEDGIKKGGILMGVRPRNDEDADCLLQNWATNRAQDVYRP